MQIKRQKKCNIYHKKDIIKRFEELAQKVQQELGFKEEPEIILLVYEAPTNPCSERRVIQEWFKENGYEDPDVKLATNDDFLARADNDEKQAEMIKTQYTTRWAEINELR